MSHNPSSPSLARRALPALLLTGASGLLLTALDRPISADSSDSSGSAATAVDGATSVVTATAPTATTAATTATTTAGGGTAATTTATADTSTTVASAVPATPVCTTITGSTISTRWGPVQVEASVTATGEICSVDAIVTPNDHDKSVRINDRAVPVLNESAMAAQGTNFDGVSGATITSNAYQQSLQSILDSLG